MTFLPAAVWKQVAQEQELESPAAKVAFKLNPTQLSRMEDIWMMKEAAAKTPPKVARCLPTCLPLLLESDALSQFKSQHPQFRDALPEMNSPQEAAQIMAIDKRLTPEDQTTLMQVLRSPEAASRWLEAAEQAAA